MLVTISEGSATGRGECSPPSDYTYETNETVIAEIEQVRAAIEAGANRDALQALMPAGAARNAVDCALWDLECKINVTTAWKIAGISPPPVIETYLTIGIDHIDAMAALAKSSREFGRLKIKLNADAPVAVVRAIRSARPDARLIVDANEAWTIDELNAATPSLAALGVELIEQPLPAGADGALGDFVGGVPICADEACTTAESIDALHSAYTHVNIKLDKTGGLTEALALLGKARDRGFGLMVGCNYGTSVGMAPALLVASQCAFVDLDAPLLQSEDRNPRLLYSGGYIASRHDVWG